MSNSAILPKPARWRTPEYAFYLAVCTCAVSYMIFVGHSISEPYDWTIAGSKPTMYLKGLKPGWLFGRQVDLSDSQWRDFRSSLPSLAALAGAHVTATRVVGALLPERLLRLQLVCGVGLIGYLHGSTALFLLALVLGNYLVAQTVAGTPVVAPLVIWGSNIAAFLAVSLFNNTFYFQKMHPALAVLDNYRGVMRWSISYNMVLLKMISYAMDLHFRRSSQAPASSAASYAPHPLPPGTITYKLRMETPRPPEAYTLVPYLCYILYPPLYIAGPTITFNAFASQFRALRSAAAAPFQARHLAQYAARLAIVLLCCELLTHHIYANALAITKAPQKTSMPAYQVGITAFWVLVFMWLKFTAIWRFFRLWALVEGVEPVENNARCVCNNYDIEGFWKNWHASYNRWLVRYMYIPLGGSSYRAANIWVIFTFVAVWHDVDMRLLGWAWMLCFFAAPEILVKMAGKVVAKRLGSDSWQYRHACAFCGAVNIIALMAANLVGFVIGLDGLKDYADEIFSNEGAQFIGGTIFVLFCASHVMFEKREGELRARAKLTKPSSS